MGMTVLKCAAWSEARHSPSAPVMAAHQSPDDRSISSTPRASSSPCRIHRATFIAFQLRASLMVPRGVRGQTRTMSRPGAAAGFWPKKRTARTTARSERVGIWGSTFTAITRVAPGQDIGQTSVHVKAAVDPYGRVPERHRAGGHEMQWRDPLVRYAHQAQLGHLHHGGGIRYAGLEPGVPVFHLPEQPGGIDPAIPGQ